MKFKFLTLLCSVAAVAVLSAGCKSISTRSATHFYAESGQEIAKRVEHTHSTGLFVKGESVAIKGTLSFTNVIAVSNAPVVTMGETKTFNADKISSQADADAIKATGEGVGNVVGAIIKK
jgi:hypothetical protein